MENLEKELKDQRELIEKIYSSVEKTRKYFLWTLIATIVAFVLPLIIMAFVLPSFFGTYVNSLQGLGV
jgi:type IV secretory pathway component VirB8